ncbi:MAG: SET domain-containing protein [bacterium]
MTQHETNWDKFVTVKDSPIHLKGIFSTVDIPPNEIIMIIRGEVIDEDECIKREDEDNNVYIFWNGDSYIDTIDTQKIKYINHDCDPNCEVDDRDDESLYLISSRKINAGEEITIDYGYEEIYSECSCYSCTG